LGCGGGGVLGWVGWGGGVVGGGVWGGVGFGGCLFFFFFFFFFFFGGVGWGYFFLFFFFFFFFFPPPPPLGVVVFFFLPRSDVQPPPGLSPLSPIIFHLLCETACVTRFESYDWSRTYRRSFFWMLNSESCLTRS